MRKSIPRFGILIAILTLVFSSSQLFGQRQVTGAITDAGTGVPLIGATVVISGTSTGTVSDMDGNYTIAIATSSDRLVFSYVSYETQEIVVEDKTVINVQLIESATALEDVVVIGYGTVKKDDLTGSVSVVTSEDLNRTPASTFTKALQGKAAGVMVTQTSGRPGGGTNIKIRGIGSINKEANPIYIIDGVRTGSLNQINPADIESLQVLKDASSTAIYGSDGANGVIIITTKRGQIGDPKVHYSSYYSIHKITKKIELMDANQYSAFFNEVLDSAGISELAYSDEFRQQYYGDGWEQGTDWQDEITTTGISLNQYLRISGGTEKSNYSISANYWDETGILLNNRATRYNVRANSDFKIGDNIKIGETINITRYQSKSGAGGFSSVKTASPLLKVHEDSNKEGFAGSWDQMGFDVNTDGVIDSLEYYNVAGRNDKPNPKGSALLSDNQAFSTNILASIYAEIAFTDWLKLRTMPSADLTQGRSRNWTPAYDMKPRSKPEAELDEGYYDNRRLAWETQLTFDKSFGEHHVTATAVFDLRAFNGNNISGSAIGFPYEQLQVFSQADNALKELYGGIGISRNMSYLARVIYDYKGKYLFTTSVRRDGNTNFAPGYQWGTFPAFSAGWKINEDLLQQVDEINLLKLRVGWGKTGNSAIGGFGYDDFLTAPISFAPVFGELQYEAPGQYVYYSFANPLIQWESASMINIGLDVNMFRNKIQFSSEYYVKNQDGLLVQKAISDVFGRTQHESFPWVNIGNVQNRGFEFSGSFRETRGNLYYSISGSITTIKNEVIYIPDELIQGNTVTRVGRPIGSLYGYIAERIITEDDFDTDGNYLWTEPNEGPPQPGDLKYTDINNDGTINSNDRTLIGKALPDMIYSFNFEVAYKGIDFTMFFNGMQNYQIYNQERANLSSFNVQDLDHNKLLSFSENYYKSDRPSTEYVRADLNNSNVNDRISTWWIEDGSFLRVKDIQIGYTLPKNILTPLNIDNVRIYASVANAYIFTSYTGRDPENAAFSSPLTSGTDSGGYPNPRSYSFGFQIDF